MYYTLFIHYVVYSLHRYYLINYFERKNNKRFNCFVDTFAFNTLSVCEKEECFFDIANVIEDGKIDGLSDVKKKNRSQLLTWGF